MPSDNIFGTLNALLSLNDTVVPGSAFPGGPPMAGLGGATNTFAQGQAAMTPEEQVPMIYRGPGEPEVIRTGHPTSGQTKTKKTDNAEDMGSMMEAFAKADVREQRRMALLLSMAGYAGSGSLEDAVENAREMTLGETLDAYNDLLSEAATRYTIHGLKVTPEQLLKQAIGYRLPAGTQWDGDLDTLGGVTKELGISDGGVLGSEEPEEEPFSGTKSFTQTSVNRDIMDPADAKALTRAMLQRELGRDPTDDEFEDFISAIQYAQKVNPDRTTTTQSTVYDEGEAVSSSTNSTTRQGIGAEGIADIALQKARANPNWAEWQAVGTYAPALFEALGATVAGR